MTLRRFIFYREVQVTETQSCVVNDCETLEEAIAKMRAAGEEDWDTDDSDYGEPEVLNTFSELYPDGEREEYQLDDVLTVPRTVP